MPTVPYVVNLPRELSNQRPTSAIARNYRNLPKIAITHASSPADAVTNYLFRTFKDKSTPRIITASLQETSPNLEAYAFEMPIQQEGTKFAKHEQDWALAAELASVRGGKPEDYLPHAKTLVDFFHNDRRMGRH